MEENEVFELLKLQCRLMDQIRIAVEKLERRIKGEQQPMVAKDRDVVALFKKDHKTEPEIPLDDRI